ncbi:MAG: glycosyltransferase family 10 [Sideroxyarcus sp.]|nr:glycosyltransferase family 10 [Sideroxyarcus sp.]
MPSLIFSLKKIYYKRLDKIISKFQKSKEKVYRAKYQADYPSAGKPRVCAYQTDFHKHYTRFFTSSNALDHPFYLVEQPEQADVVVFINTVDDKVLRPNQHAILFFHEPLAYAHLYQTEIHENRFSNANLEVVGHPPTPSLFIKNSDGIKYHRSIPYVHFHHMATYEQLNTIDETKRIKLICSIASGLNGIPGYQNRRHFFEMFSVSNPRFDLFGKFNEFSSAIPSYRGQCIFKWKTVSQYKYSLVIENSTDDYYISEKIFDALICGSMPIYHGSDKIFEVLPKEWFYYLPSLDAAEIIKLNAFIETDAHRAVSSNRAEICRVVYEKFSFFSALEKLLANESLPIVAK